MQRELVRWIVSKNYIEMKKKRGRASDEEKSCWIEMSERIAEKSSLLIKNDIGNYENKHPLITSL